MCARVTSRPTARVVSRLPNPTSVEYSDSLAVRSAWPDCINIRTVPRKRALIAENELNCRTVCRRCRTTPSDDDVDDDGDNDEDEDDEDERASFFARSRVSPVVAPPAASLAGADDTDDAEVEDECTATALESALISCGLLIPADNAAAVAAG